MVRDRPQDQQDPTNDREADREFVQRPCGYLLAGGVSEQVLPIFHGTGANDKSTFIETTLSLLGWTIPARPP
jgi:phage/plasmid-associated DNA primase